MSGVQLQQRAARADWDEDELVGLPCTAGGSNEPFCDNYDHLAALEREATLMLAAAYLRQAPSDDPASSDIRARFAKLFPIIPAGTTAAQVRRLFEETSAANRCRETAAERDGVDLNLTTFCRERSLGPFERSAVMLLFMQYTSPRFMEIFRRCRFEAEMVGIHTNDRHRGMLIGTLLFIICRDYREQVECRRHFSAESPLVREDALVSDGVGESTNLIASKVSLHERIICRILGDGIMYRSSMRFIRWERGSVSLDQVVLPDGLKEEVVACVGNFLEDRAAGRFVELDAFFGYGTGLALLFHGPSGTGKTMMARALATRFDRRIVSLAASAFEKWGNPEDVLARVFREAESLGGIVLLDECDDLFTNDSRLGRALLLELEKSRCAVIMATNKPVDLDPAMERRFAMKVSFPIPDAGTRLRLWQSLMPAGFELAPDVDIAEIAERYQLSGGLIKNCMLLAMTRSRSRQHGRVCITREHLERVVELQTPTPSGEDRICRRYAPIFSFTDLQLRNRERDGLQGAARAWQKLKGDGMGLSVLISTSFTGTGLGAAEALAKECGLEVRRYNYSQLQSATEIDRLLDPLTQQRLTPMEYAFSRTLGASSMTLIIDYAGDLGRAFDKESAGAPDYYLADLKDRLRTHTGLLCMVTGPFKPQLLPLEFNLHFVLEQPSEDVQIRRWEERLGQDGIREDELADLVERWPMHVEEIDFVARRATIQSVIRGGVGRPGLEEVREVIGRYRRTDRSPVLFGGD